MDRRCAAREPQKIDRLDCGRDASQQVLQRHETAPQARFLGAHSNPEVALQVPRAVEREPQQIDRLWAPPAVFGGMSLREPAKFDELVLAGSRVRPNFPSRLHKASWTRRASSRYWKHITKSSMYLIMWASPRSRGLTTRSNHRSST